MKKYLIFLVAAVAMMTVSCKKDDSGKNGGTDGQALYQATYRIKSYSHSGDVFTYTYNTDGTVAKIDMSYEGKPYTSAVFTYSGTSLTIKDALNDNKLMFDVVLNEKNLATKVTDYTKDGRVLTFKYDDNNFMIATTTDGVLKSVQNIDEDGNVEFWTRVGIADQVNESVDAAGWRKKMHTYYSTKNAAGIHSEWDEDTNVKRWFYETGLLGRASVNVMKTAWWYGVVNEDKTAVNQEYAAKLAYYPLDVDANGCIKVELKLYDTKEKYESDPSSMGEDDKYEFTCEKI